MGFNTVEFVHLGLLVVNVVVYGCAIWLYLRPATTPRRCPLCGSRSDAVCVGMHTPARKTEILRLSAVTSGQAPGGTRN